MSLPGANRAKLRTPASATSNSGQALGLRWQNSRKSQARALGSTTRLPWAYPAQKPVVGPVISPLRMAARAAAGVRAAGSKGGVMQTPPVRSQPAPSRPATRRRQTAWVRAAATARVGSVRVKATACPGRSWARAGRSAVMTVAILA